MIRTLSLLAFAPLALLAVAPTSPASPAGTSTEPVAVHCQVPCGIYGDTMRIDQLMEDAATIEKGMQQILQMEADGGKPANQLVRWVMTKDEHAASIQETVASYWLAQRIKAPAEESVEALSKYHQQLRLLHGVTVAAMKCKQTTDVAHVAKLRELAHEFSATYFSAEDLKHLHGEHGEHGSAGK